MRTVQVGVRLVTAAVMFSCGSGRGGGGDGSSVEAEGAAASAGIQGYAVAKEEAGLTATVKGRGGNDRGTVGFTPVPGGYQASATAGGVTVTEVGHTWTDTESGATTVTRERTAGVVTLRTEAEFDSAGNLVWAGLVAPLQGETIPPVGSVRITPRGRWAVLTLASSSSPETTFPEADPAEWLAAVGATGAFGSEAGLLLTGAMTDSALVASLAARVEPEDEGEGAQSGTGTSTRRGALHLSDRCKGMANKVKASSEACCKQCADLGKGGLGGAMTGVIGFLGGIDLAIQTRPGCACCQQKLGLEMSQIVKCVESFTETKTEESCADAPGRESFQVGKVSADGHSCQFACVAEACGSACAEIGVTPETGGVSACIRGGDCACKFTTPLCKTAFPDRYCDDAFAISLGAGDVACHLARCGDGRVTTTCTAHPETNEACDTLSSSPSCKCAADCRSCEKDCECDPTNPSSWPAGQYCGTNCALQAVPTCESDMRDFFTNNAVWCDPAASASWCEKGHTCAASNCRCVKDAPASTDGGDGGDGGGSLPGCFPFCEDHPH